MQVVFWETMLGEFLTDITDKVSRISRLLAVQVVFRETMLAEFLTVLMQVLVHKSHDLLQEEIVNTVYNMATVDFEVFYTKFLPHFLQSMDGLDNNQRTVLVHNFKEEKVRTLGPLFFFLFFLQ